MVVEALTFKLALDFFVYLKKNRITITKTRLGFYDDATEKTEYTDFLTTEELRAFYEEHYVPFDNCFVGDIVSIQLFLAGSDLYDFETEYRASDLTKNFTLVSGSSFDIQRNSQRAVLTKRQTGFIERAVQDYKKYYDEIYRIYKTGIYSPCYAEPGWSEGTWYLNQLRIAFTVKDNIVDFPYDDANIINEPPE